MTVVLLALVSLGCVALIARPAPKPLPVRIKR
jgi:hypothetical protein